MARNNLVFAVPGVSCAHCRAAITEEVGRLHGVVAVDVDLERKRVSVQGDSIDEPSVRRAIEQAGYAVAAQVDGSP